MSKITVFRPSYLTFSNSGYLDTDPCTACKGRCKHRFSLIIFVLSVFNSVNQCPISQTVG